MKYKWMSRKLLYITAAVVSLIAGIQVFLNIGAEIPIEGEKIEIYNNPAIHSVNIKISYIETAYADTLEALVFAGGSIFKPIRLTHNAVLVEHPSGNFLFDTGLGKDIDQQFHEMPYWASRVFQFKKVHNAGEVLGKRGKKIQRIILSHMHFDHASGIEDFAGTDIYTTKRELDYAKSDDAHPPAFLLSQYDGDISWKIIDFTSGPYEIFPKSFDLYGDGSVVFVPIEGHSPGSLGMFINRSAHERYFFTGDLTWNLKGITNPSEKNLLAGYWVDHNRIQVKEEIRRVHLLLKLKPEIKAVPAHDVDAYENFKKMTYEG